MTCAIERLETRIKAAEDQLTLLGGMIDTSRRVVAAHDFKVEAGAAAPQIIKATDCGSLALGNESPMRIIDAVTVAKSHTGDAVKTVVHTTKLEGGSLGPNGFVRINAIYYATGVGLHGFYVGFGGTDVKRCWFTSDILKEDFVPTFVWNQDDPAVQAAGIMLSYVHSINTEAPTALTKDTTNDVDITFSLYNSLVGDTAYLLFALVEACYRP